MDNNSIIFHIILIRFNLSLNFLYNIIIPILVYLQIFHSIYEYQTIDILFNVTKCLDIVLRITDNTISLHDNIFFYFIFKSDLIHSFTLLISGKRFIFTVLRMIDWKFNETHSNCFHFTGEENQRWKSTNRWTCRDTRQLAILLTRYTTLRYPA